MNKIRTTIYLDEKIAGIVKSLATDNGMSVSAFITMLINNYKNKLGE